MILLRGSISTYPGACLGIGDAGGEEEGGEDSEFHNWDFLEFNIIVGYLEVLGLFIIIVVSVPFGVLARNLSRRKRRGHLPSTLYASISGDPEGFAEVFKHAL